MSNSSLVDVKVPAHSGNYQKGRSGKKIKKITIHHMAGILSAEQCGRIFQQAGKKASSNYGIGNDGRIGLYVDEENRAYTSSSRANDLEAVTIEVSNCERNGQWRVSDIALETTIDLCTDICKRNEITKLVVKDSLTYHRMFANTTCPGEYLLSKMQYIADTVNARLNGSTQSSIQNKSTLELANEVIAGKYGTGEARKQALGSRYREVQAMVNSILLGEVKVVPVTKSNEEVAREVIQGLYGNGDARVKNLTKAGYDAKVIQDIVNRMLS